MSFFIHNFNCHPPGQIFQEHDQCPWTISHRNLVVGAQPTLVLNLGAYLSANLSGGLPAIYQRRVGVSFRYSNPTCRQ